MSYKYQRLIIYYLRDYLSSSLYDPNPTVTLPNKNSDAHFHCYNTACQIILFDPVISAEDKSYA